MEVGKTRDRRLWYQQKGCVRRGRGVMAFGMVMVMIPLGFKTVVQARELLHETFVGNKSNASRIRL